MEQALAAGARGAPPKEYLPNKIVTQNRETDTINGVKMTLIHIANAHTSGDLVVYLPDEKLAITGDLIGPGDPLIHRNKNGQSEGWIRFVSALVQLDANTYVLGHADPETKAQVQANLKNAEEKRAKIAALVKQNKSLDEIKQSLGEAAKPGAPPRGETSQLPSVALVASRKNGLPSRNRRDSGSMWSMAFSATSWLGSPMISRSCSTLVIGVPGMDRA